MGLLVAGARSTGTTGACACRSSARRPPTCSHARAASWLVAFLAGNPEWKHAAREEAHTLLAMHAAAAQDTRALTDRLATVSLEAWEQCTPAMDKVIRETLRLAQPHTAMRRNVGPDTYIGGACVPSGAYVVYPFSDVHLNPEIYPDPWRFDPGRPEHDRPYAWVGWGGGEQTITIAST